MASIPSQWLLISALGILTVASLLIGLLGRNWRKSGVVAVVSMVAASTATWLLAARVFVLGPVSTLPFLRFDLLGSSLTFHVDRLSAVFLLVVPFVGLAALMYAIEYMTKVYPNRAPGRYYPFALLLVATTIGVVTVSDLFFFFVFWEMMTLVSWVLVWFDREDEQKVQAAWIYFFATHAAAACILIAALLIYSNANSFAFKDVTASVARIIQSSTILGHLLMSLFLVGFGTKAGMFPLGGWLPKAYSAAPSPASAAFASTMTKLGIYGIARVFFQFLQVPSFREAWGVIIAAFGALSIFFGTLSALREEDSKRLLSFHIIGQIGYMLLGIGIAVFFFSSNVFLASLALIAALYHLINNAIYKPLLFLNVGAAEYKTGLRDLNKLGGLGAFMPITMTAAIIAALSIAGIPPFNGFASKWLVYQSAFQGGLRFPLFLLLGLVAMFISLVTLASFMKLVGSMFLGKLAAGVKVDADVPRSMSIPQVALALACLLLGVFPMLALVLLRGTAQDVLGPLVPVYASLFGYNPVGIDLGGGKVGIWNPVYLVVALFVCMLIAYGIVSVGRAPARETESWYGGEQAEPDEVRFKAHGFCLPFKEAFTVVFPRIETPRIRLISSVQKLLNFDAWLYRPITDWLGTLADRLSRTHTGVPQVYMIWQLIGMILVFAILLSLNR